MKTDSKAPFYFSAYRLKTLEQAVAASNEISQSPYLQSLLSGKTKTMNRIRVYPLANPYKQEATQGLKETAAFAEKTTVQERNWFHHYE